MVFVRGLVADDQKFLWISKDGKKDKIYPEFIE